MEKLIKIIKLIGKVLITAEFDKVLNRNSLADSTSKLPSDYVAYEIIGGNHAQFGWYGPQKGDGTATIDTKTQQDVVITHILRFIE
ncbi:alpha/beta hydrolase [Acholeplasma vituli]|uniref:Alpha/beta hydrolase n=1 Tax=Paracholeplasma vituli TaxID=69473 RepID=A0ABT2PWM0_9MOLU|nr:alpha/beta hydrolase [Paracholeplasma vituli]MCU0105356.1 alpha/beta hydrolase [Paracholeplasma vituli]